MGCHNGGRGRCRGGFRCNGNGRCLGVRFASGFGAILATAAIIAARAVTVAVTAPAVAATTAAARTLAVLGTFLDRGCGPGRLVAYLGRLFLAIIVRLEARLVAKARYVVALCILGWLLVASAPTAATTTGWGPG